MSALQQHARGSAMPSPAQRRTIILVADDFALTGGVSAGIESLARARRISATSALVTLPRWKRDGHRLAPLRDRIALGLHVNLTLGQPLGPMPQLAPRGCLPSIAALSRMAWLGRIAREEIASEITRQLAAFEAIVGHPPDIIDGHQHAHALPLVRDGLVKALQRCFASAPVRSLVRIPSSRTGSLLAIKRSRAKAITLSLLTRGFATKITRAGYPTNNGFSGVTSFAAHPATAAAELESAAEAARGLHLVMCHPGLPSPELARLDPVTDRRSVELALLGRDNALTPHLWSPLRTADGAPVDWRRERELCS